jgi:hypothetical protein
MFKKYLLILVLWRVFFFELGLKQYLLDYSVEVLPSIKTESSIWMKILAEMGDKLGLGVAVGLSLHYMPHYKSLIVIVAFTFGTAINTTLKIFYHEPRPYLLSELIIPARCKSIEYGMPSGHTMVFIVVYLTFVRLIETRY